MDLSMYTVFGELVSGRSGSSISWYCSFNGIAIPFNSFSLCLALPLGSPGSVWWLAVSICICIGQVLVEPLREQPYQAPVSKCFLASAIVLRFGVCRLDGSLGGAVSGLFLSPCSMFLFLLFLWIGIFSVKNFEMHVWPFPSTGDRAYLLEVDTFSWNTTQRTYFILFFLNYKVCLKYL